MNEYNLDKKVVCLKTNLQVLKEQIHEHHLELLLLIRHDNGNDLCILMFHVLFLF